jgi:hypothetical protein
MDTFRISDRIGDLLQSVLMYRRKECCGTLLVNDELQNRGGAGGSIRSTRHIEIQLPVSHRGSPQVVPGNDFQTVSVNRTRIRFSSLRKAWHTRPGMWNVTP